MSRTSFADGDDRTGPRQLSRSLQTRHVAMISVGGIIGAGLFVGSSTAIVTAGPAVVCSYLLAGTLILLVMRMIGEMALAYPDTRAFTDFARRGLGATAGFVCGWLYWYFWIMVVPVEAIAGATLLQQWLPWPAWQLGVALMAVMTAVNLMSARSYGEFEFWFASLKIAAIAVFIVLAAAFLLGWRGGTPHPLANLAGAGGFVPHGIGAVLGTTVTVFFSLTGAEIATVAAVESAEPARAIARLTTAVGLRILVFYVLSIGLIVASVPWTRVRSGESPFLLTLAALHLGWADTALAAVILTAVLSCLNSAFYVCSRVLFLLAEQGDAPRWLVQVNRRQVPTRSVWLAALAGLAGILIAAGSAQRVFRFLVDASGALMVFIYLLVAIAQLRLRRERESLNAPSPSLKMWGHPWLSVLAIAGFIAILVAMALSASQRRDLLFSLITLALITLASRLRRRTAVLSGGT